MPYRVVLTLKNGTVTEEMGPVINSRTLKPGDLIEFGHGGRLKKARVTASDTMQRKGSGAIEVVDVVSAREV